MNIADLKIGVLFTVYNCEPYLKDCLDPWFELKNSKYNIIFAATSGMFSDYHTLGIPYRNKETLEILSNYDLDFLITTKGKNTLKEDESRNLCINYLNKQNCDLVWVMDGDEVYTKNQIVNILEFILKNPDPDWYSVNFKNLVIHKNLFMDYPHTRIVWNNRYSGIAYYYFDNQFIYNDDSNFNSKKGLEIPKNVAYIQHNCWLNQDIRTKDKILYQNYRYCGVDGKVPIESRCSYIWNIEKNSLEFNPLHYSYFNIPIPILHEELSCFSYDFTLFFNREENKFDITKIQRDVDAEFEIYDGDTELVIYSTKMKLVKDVNYFIIPSSKKYNDDKNFHSFIIKVYEYNRLIHNEKMHINGF